MGRSGMGGGAGRSGGGRSGGSRSGGRSAGGSFSGRSGGFSGGGRPAGGFSGGSRPAGGFSGGGRPVGGGYQRPPRQPRPPRPPRRPWLFGFPYRRGFGGSTVIINHGGDTYEKSPKRSRLSGIFTTVVVLLIFGIFMSVMFSFMRAGSMSGMNDTYSVSTDQITRSTIKREKLHLGLSDASGYVTDECGWIRNKTTLLNGLRDFYDSTGILPYVYIIDNVEGDYDPSTEKLEQFAAEQYTALFSDEGHILLLFWDYGGAYEYVLWLGDDAAGLMDQQACDILFDYIDFYYYAADTEEAFFAEAFSKAGERIMTVTRSASDYIFAVVLVIVVCVLVSKLVRAGKDKKAERERKAEEILNTPLEKYGSNEDILDNLESKYEKEI